MILVDTSVWVEHLRRTSVELSSLLKNVKVLAHPFVVGELSCGYLKHRNDFLDYLRELPQATVAENEEVLELIETRKLMGHGIGWVDAHLLASALLTGSPLWTSDRKLRSLCTLLGVLY